MNTGDGVDMVWYSSWPGSPDYARQGAFMELEDYLELPEYADLKNAISETAWNDVKIDGHIYCIPAPETTYAANNGIIYRSDLCEKLNLPVPNTVENAVAYLEGVKAAYPDVNPLCTAFTRGYDFARLEQVVWAPGTVNYGLVPVGSADNLVNYYASDAQLEDYKLIRSLVEGHRQPRPAERYGGCRRKAEGWHRHDGNRPSGQLHRPLQRVGKRQDRGSLQG